MPDSLTDESQSLDREMFPAWKDNQKWRDELARKASYKSLDIVEDDMNIGNQTHNYYGDTKPQNPVASLVAEVVKPKKSGALIKTLLGGALVASGIGAGLGVPLLLKGGTEIIETTINKTQTETISPGFGLSD